MAIQLRQICLVAENLAPVIEDLTGILGIRTCYIDPGVAHFGLENTLMAVGNNFLEVVAPIEENTAAGRYLARRGGDGGYMVICQADSRETQQAVRGRALEQGVRVAHESERETWNICQLHPRDMIAAFFEIDWDQNDDFDGNWMPAGGMAWQSAVDQSRTVDFTGVYLQSEDAEALAARWSAVAGLPLEDGPPLRLVLNNASIYFVEPMDDRGPGLAGVELRVRDADAIRRAAGERGCETTDDYVEICGTRFYLKGANS